VLAMTSSFTPSDHPQWDSSSYRQDQLIEMLAFTGHEMNNAVTRLLVNMHLLVRETGSQQTDHQRSITDALEWDARLLKKIAQMYLNVAQLEDNVLKMNPSLVDPVTDIFEPLMAGYQELLSRREITCQIQSDFETPIEADAMLLTSACDNLFSNAIKYADMGGEIRITMTQTEFNYQISIWNSGTAMDTETIQYVFERFARGKGTSGQEGFGIGLYLVQRIVSLHGGTIEVTSSAPEGGTRFTLTLPKIGTKHRH
jgi:signal transduction histidine kinase